MNYSEIIKKRRDELEALATNKWNEDCRKCKVLEKQAKKVVNDIQEKYGKECKITFPFSGEAFKISFNLPNFRSIDVFVRTELLNNEVFYSVEILNHPIARKYFQIDEGNMNIKINNYIELLHLSVESKFIKAMEDFVDFIIRNINLC